MYLHYTMHTHRALKQGLDMAMNVVTRHPSKAEREAAMSWSLFDRVMGTLEVRHD